MTHDHDILPAHILRKLETARWVLLAITAIWAGYLLWQFLIGLAFNLAMDGGLDQGGEMSDLSNTPSLILHLLDLLALVFYGSAAWLIWRWNRLALPVYGAGFLIDMAVWITASANYAGYELTSLMHTSAINWLINILLLCVLVGLVFLRQARVLR